LTQEASKNDKDDGHILMKYISVGISVGWMVSSGSKCCYVCLIRWQRAW